MTRVKSDLVQYALITLTEHMFMEDLHKFFKREYDAFNVEQMFM